jgi:hypothetical protein
MAEKKPDGEPNSQGSPMTKTDAVRRVMAKLGREAKPLEIQKHLKADFNIDMTTDQISSTKADVLRKRKAKKKAPAKAAAKPAPAAARAKPAPAQPAKPSVLLEDVLAVRDLVDRVGAAHLRTLIDTLAR